MKRLVASIILAVFMTLTFGACAPSETVTTPPAGTAPVPAPPSVPTPTPSSTPTPPPPPSISTDTIEVTELTTVSEGFGYISLLGFVKNVGTSPISSVFLTLTVYDKAAVVIGGGPGDVTVTLFPGERYPFAILMSGKLLESWDSSKLTVETGPYSQTLPRLCPELKVISHRWEKEGLITGILQNTSHKTAVSVSVEAAGYDKQGKLIAVGLGGPVSMSIGSGVSVAFEIPFALADPSKVTDYKLFISA